MLCCGYTLTDFPKSIRLTSLALWQSNDCPSASKATLMNIDKYFMWIHYERLHNHNKAKHNKTVCIFLGIYCISTDWLIGRGGRPITVASLSQISIVAPCLWYFIRATRENRNTIQTIPKQALRFVLEDLTDKGTVDAFRKCGVESLQISSLKTMAFEICICTTCVQNIW